MKQQKALRRTQAWAWAAMGVLALLALSTEAIAGRGGITGCQVITAPGSYVLQANLIASRTGSCLVVQADSVTIDLNGFSIIGNGTGNGIADNGTPYQQITVRNGAIRNFDTGIALASSTMVQVENVTATNNANAGIAVGDYSIIVGSTASLNLGDGILAGSYSSVTGNTASQNGTSGGHGIAVGGGSAVSGNTANGNGGDGIQVNSRSKGSQCGASSVRNNAATHNRGTGINLSSFHHNTVSGNTATANGAGMLIVSCPSNITSNTVTTNGGANMALADAGGACEGSDNIIQ